MSVTERTLNPETHTAPDYKRLIYETDAALHFYLKDDKEWWVAHGPENEPPGRLNGPWLFWTTYPSGGWELDFFTKEIASHHLEELYYIDYDGNEAHSIHRARLVPMDDAPEFVQEVVGWNSRDVDTDRDCDAEPRTDGGDDVCPECGDPVSGLVVAGPGDVTAQPCGHPARSLLHESMDDARPDGGEVL